MKGASQAQAGEERRFARPRRLTTGPYLARNPLVVAAMAAGDLFGLIAAPHARGGQIQLPSDRPLNVLVANSGHLGDLVLLLPLLDSLRKHARVASVGTLIGPWGRPVFEAADQGERTHVASHWMLDRAGDSRAAKLARHARSRWQAVRSLRAARYDLAIDTYGWFGNAAELLWAAGIPVRAGFTSGGAGTLYTHRVAFDPHAPVGANQQRLARALFSDLPDSPATARYPGFVPDAQALRGAQALGPFVVMHLGAGGHTRTWPREAWLSLSARLRALGLTLVFTGAPSEAAYVTPICQAAGGQDLVGKLNFRAFTSYIAAASALVCVDTVAGHLAACFDVPSVILCNGVQPARRWRPNQPFVRVLTNRVACAPCSRSAGCASMACLQRIEAELVFEELRAALAQKQRSSAA